MKWKLIEDINFFQSEQKERKVWEDEQGNLFAKYWYKNGSFLEIRFINRKKRFTIIKYRDGKGQIWLKTYENRQERKMLIGFQK